MSEERDYNIAETVADLAAHVPEKLQTEDGQEHVFINGELHGLTPLVKPKYPMHDRVFHRLSSLIAYVGEFSAADARAYVDALIPMDGVTVKVIVNAATGTAPLENELHTAECLVKLDRDFSEWVQFDRELRAQVDFAEFINDHIDCFRHPDGATMLEVAQTMRIHTNADFSSKVNLTNDAINLKFQEEIDGEAGNGDMRIPDRFTIGIPVFERGSAWEIKGRLRYRVRGGSLSIGYKLHRIDRVFESAVDEDIIAPLEAAGITTYCGQP